MNLGQKQRLFTKLIARLITWAYSQGYELSVGDAYRDPRVFGEVGTLEGYGSSKSNHKSRLAMDLNLFKPINGDLVYQRYTENYKEMGEYWQSLHVLCAWGGEDDRQDGNHFSFYHQDRW